jgi:hypothetical protein
MMILFWDLHYGWDDARLMIPQNDWLYFSFFFLFNFQVV